VSSEQAAAVAVAVVVAVVKWHCYQLECGKRERNPFGRINGSDFGRVGIKRNPKRRWKECEVCYFYYYEFEF